MKSAAVFLAILNAGMAFAYVDMTTCKVPGAKWGPPNCSGADETECHNWCFGGKIRCAGITISKSSGYWNRLTNQCDCYCY
ncbi:hypothetical protein LZ30DRAFT_720588 [Colletotrichum cereale]|nr:hypothetical protein LZ30DRAFT_720588 [Colletotrichum cereale]